MTKETREGFGRPSKYDPKFCEGIIEHFSVAHTKTGVVQKTTDKDGKVTEVEKTTGNDFPTIAGYCAKLMISKQTLHRWVGKHKDFSDAYQIAKCLQEDMLANNALSGAYPGSFPQFFAKNQLDYEDVQKTRELGPEEADGSQEKEALRSIGIRVKGTPKEDR